MIKQTLFLFTLSCIYPCRNLRCVKILSYYTMCMVNIYSCRQMLLSKEKPVNRFLLIHVHVRCSCTCTTTTPAAVSEGSWWNVIVLTQHQCFPFTLSLLAISCSRSCFSICWFLLFTVSVWFGLGWVKWNQIKRQSGSWFNSWLKGKEKSFIVPLLMSFSKPYTGLSLIKEGKNPLKWHAIKLFTKRNRAYKLLLQIMCCFYFNRFITFLSCMKHFGLWI